MFRLTLSRNYIELLAGPLITGSCSLLEINLQHPFKGFKTGLKEYLKARLVPICTLSLDYSKIGHTALSLKKSAQRTVLKF